MNGNQWQNKKFSVPSGSNKISQKDWNKIFRPSFWQRLLKKIDDLLYNLFWRR